MPPTYEKMSKSRGNVVQPEEVVHGVADLDPGHEFRDPAGNVIDFLSLGVWQDVGGSGFFFTATRFGKRPVFLHHRGNPVPALLLIDGEERVQHWPGESEFWEKLLEREEARGQG